MQRTMLKSTIFVAALAAGLLANAGLDAQEPARGASPGAAPPSQGAGQGGMPMMEMMTEMKKMMEGCSKMMEAKAAAPADTKEQPRG